jgi:hypothetical protein
MAVNQLVAQPYKSDRVGERNQQHHADRLPREARSDRAINRGKAANVLVG